MDWKFRPNHKQRTLLTDLFSIPKLNRVFATFRVSAPICYEMSFLDDRQRLNRVLVAGSRKRIFMQPVDSQFLFPHPKWWVTSSGKKEIIEIQWKNPHFFFTRQAVFPVWYSSKWKRKSKLLISIESPKHVKCILSWIPKVEDQEPRR